MDLFEGNVVARDRVTVPNRNELPSFNNSAFQKSRAS
jgi:hypothetical protein